MLLSFSFLHVHRCFGYFLMKNFITFSFSIILLLALSSNVSAKISPFVIFSQEITAFDESGTQYPTVEINPASMTGMNTFTYALGQLHKLVIETNISDGENRGLAQFARTVQRSYQFVEEESGRALKENILLYIIEFDTVPEYYSFQMSFSDPETQWGEVRLVLVEKNAPLHGPGASEAIHELLYDTLPHELGHDVLGTILNLQHDIGNRPSYHTRWFIEGVCEVLAKRFSRSEVPYLWEEFLARRNVDTVLANTMIRDAIFQWSQKNTNSPVLESDLYGASMLVLLLWSRDTGVNTILTQIQEQEKPLVGSELVTMMESATGLSRDRILDQGYQLGKDMLGLAEKRLPFMYGKN